MMGGVWLFDIVVLPMRLQTPSAPSVLSLTSPSAYLSAVTEPLRRQLYQAHLSKYFLASTMVSGFDFCIYDEYQDGVVSGGLPTVSIPLQYSTGLPNQNNWTTKGGQRDTKWKKRSQTITICR